MEGLFHNQQVGLLSRLNTTDGFRPSQSRRAVDGEGGDHFLDGHIHIDAAEGRSEGGMELVKQLPGFRSEAEPLRSRVSIIFRAGA